jgi:putative lipoic acid-binding regulatory protein
MIFKYYFAYSDNLQLLPTPANFMTTVPPQALDPSQPAALTYPCPWAYTVIGTDRTLLQDVIIAACSPCEVTIREGKSSSKGTYHSLTAELLVPSEAVRLRIYETLKSSPLVKIIL